MRFLFGIYWEHLAHTSITHHMHHTTPYPAQHQHTHTQHLDRTSITHSTTQNATLAQHSTSDRQTDRQTDRKTGRDECEAKTPINREPISCEDEVSLANGRLSLCDKEAASAEQQESLLGASTDTMCGGCRLGMSLDCECCGRPHEVIVRH